MVDASVGGKAGVDFNGFKNQIGLFNEPEVVFINTEFLKTLPERELVSGFAEVLKHYLIADKTSFQNLATHYSLLTTLNWDEVVAQNVKIKSTIVEQDPQEKNIRKALNFGHTVGHAVESYSLQKDKKPLLHGEAITIGMLCETYLSTKVSGLAKKQFNEIVEYFIADFKLSKINKSSFATLLDFMRNDKKNEGNQINFSFGEPRIGQCS